MIGYSKKNIENYPREYFWGKEKEGLFKIYPWVSATRRSNNWALIFTTTGGMGKEWLMDHNRLA